MVYNHWYNSNRLFLLLFIWLSASITVSGWPWLWGMLPWGSDAAIWSIPFAVMGTVILYGIDLSRLSNRRFWAISEKFKHRYYRLTAVFAVYISSIWIASYFCSRNHFMGDGWAVAERVARPFYFYRDEPLDIFIHQAFHRFLGLFDLNNGELTYALLHCLLLPVFLTVCWKIVAALVDNGFDRWVLWSIIVFTSSLQLFFGYVEGYTLVQLVLSFYLLYSIRQLRNSENSIPLLPTIIFILAVITHLSAVVLFPSLLYLWLNKYNLAKQIKIDTTVLIFSICGILLSAILSKANLEPLVPVAGPIDGADYPYRMFELRHVWDKMNLILLICPVTLIFVFIALANWKKIKVLREPFFVFIFWCAAGCMFFSFVYNPDLGIRDWDLLSLPSIPLALLSGAGLLRLLDHTSNRESFFGALFLVVVIHGATWIWINADMDRGVRFLDQVRMADFHRGSDRVQLGKMLDERGYTQEAMRQFKMVDEKHKSWGATAIKNMGRIFLNSNMPDSTIYYVKRLFNIYKMEKKDAKYFYEMLMIAYDMKEAPDSATMAYLFMRRRGLSLNESEIVSWGNHIKHFAGIYNRLISQQPSDSGIISFFLRYYTFVNDTDKLDTTYNSILKNNFSPQEWSYLLEFAEISGHQKYYALMLREALKQHPENHSFKNYEFDFR